MFFIDLVTQKQNLIIPIPKIIKFCLKSYKKDAY